ncbi:MAG: HIT domain-containing protein [Halothiobacillaceae bacterium]|nr:MAG: HIT domain-containing protein [Halothiobacillaceae bacterium]
MKDFELHPRLAADTVEITRLPLCRVLLMNDAHYPWVILVPQRADIREIHELSDAEQVRLIRESSLVSRVMAELFKADKMNIAALGNVVPQLHIHHIARFESDPAWPRPIWGQLPPQPYPQTALEQRLDELSRALRSRTHGRESRTDATEH